MSKKDEVADGIRKLLTSGDLPPGALIPSEDDLSQTHGVSKSTIRAALAVLRSEGFIITVSGLGSFTQSLKCNRCGTTTVQKPCPYSDVPCELRMTEPIGDWQGCSPRVCGEHRTTGTRAWCYADQAWCYPHDPCPGCRSLEQQIADAVELLQTNGYYVEQNPGAEG